MSNGGSGSKKRGRNCAEVKDDVYLEDQRSRDAHCVKEEETDTRCSFLEQENLKFAQLMKYAKLENENAQLERKCGKLKNKYADFLERSLKIHN